MSKYFDKEEIVNLIDKSIGGTIREILTINAINVQTMTNDDKDAYVMMANRISGVIDMADHLKKEFSDGEEA